MSSSAQATADAASIIAADYRLPTNVKPRHYDITIRTDLEKLVFDGFVSIDLDVVMETSTIILNSAHTKLGDASLYSEALQSEQIRTPVIIDTTLEQVSITLGSALPAGSKATLRIGFTGELDESMMGYYRSEWTDEKKIKYYALTQFEATAARRAFPCWDEPSLKATFAITMISREGIINLSSMPVLSEEVYVPGMSAEALIKTPELMKLFASLTTADQAGDKWKITRFDTTPLMSTYTVAWANGDFVYLEDSYTSSLSGKTRPLRIYATKDHIHETQFALDVKKKALSLCEQVFDVEYPLPKLDTLVVSDFEMDAIGNWGLITGRTSAFLLDPEKADLRAKINVVTEQCHEVALMWFGNATTMSWWDSLYLNKGFATLMGEVIVPNKIWPGWKLESQFINNHLSRATDRDAKLSSHPIEVECPDANQINQIFDLLSYSKSSSVLRMLANYVGEDRFMKGVSIYLKTHLYANTVTKDLWEGIAEATGIDVAKFMDNWVTKMGFPVITVTETANGVRVRQDRFLATGPADPKENETIWGVPLGIVSTNEHDQIVIDRDAILDEREKTVDLDTSKPFKLNNNTAGFYRVLYSPERLSKIATEAAKENSIFSLSDRIGLVHDAMALSKAGFATISSSLTLMEILKDEKEFLVWESIANNLESLISIWFEHDQIREHLEQYIRDLSTPLVKRLSFECSPNESPDHVALKTLAIRMAIAGKDQGVIKELKSRFQHYLATGDDSRIPVDLLGRTYVVAVRFGGRVEFEAMKRIYAQPKTPTAANWSMIAMGATYDTELAKEALDFMMTEVREQDMDFIMGPLGGNIKMRRLAAKFFKENYWPLHKRLEGNYTFTHHVQYCFGSLTTQKDYDETVEFFKDKDTSKYDNGYLQVLNNIKERMGIIERSTADVSQWLLKRK